MDIKNSFNDSSAAAASSSRRALTGENVMVGFDEDLLAIKDQLCGESSKLQILPIFGMGGIGKTTLTINVYDDPLIKEIFHIRAWITISQDYSKQELLAKLLNLMKVRDAEISTHRYSSLPMDEQVYKTLKGRRYLIVLDDIWSTKAWDDLRMLFPDDGKGSRIILTTRLSDVAAYPDPRSSIYEMRLMDVGRGLNLLRQRMCIHQDCSPDLGDIEEEITRSCGGLPLAIVVMAGVLSTVTRSRSSWGRIAKNVKPAGATEDGQLKKILSLSYTHLPRHLRPCFLYMAGFPEDYEIHFSKLSRLWIAEGFVRASSASGSLEKKAEAYLEDLVKRSLVLVNKWKTNGKIKTCSLHDVMRDLCIRKADLGNKHRLYVAHETDLCALGSRRSWRVLDMGKRPYASGSRLYGSIPKQAFELFNLRYLAMAYFSDIPAVISNLQNLQTLIIHTLEDVVHLPFEIWRMSKLRHLVALFGPLPSPEGAAHFALEDLQTLSEVRNLECTDMIVEMIPNIKKLGIVYFDDECGHDYQLDNLVRLHQLEKLKVTVYPGFQGKLDPVLPASLQKITLSGRVFSWEDMAILASLPNLRVLKLRLGWQGKRWETTEGNFAQLKYLLIEGSDLQEWATESDHFPSLECLLLHSCWNLDEIPDGIGDIPTLVLVDVKAVNESLVDSAKRLEQEQQSLGNYDLQVRYR